MKGAKTTEEYLTGCKGAIASIYSSWKKDHDEWSGTFEFAHVGPPPVLLCVADNATRAGWLFEHLTREYDLFRNPDDDDRKRWLDAEGRVAAGALHPSGTVHGRATATRH